MCFQNGQGELGTDLVVCLVKFSLFASVHHVPHEVNPFDAGLARAYHLFVDDSGELDGTLHHHTVGDDGREDIVHLGNGLHHIGIVDCSRQVEEHEIEVGLRCHQISAVFTASSARLHLMVYGFFFSRLSCSYASTL